MTTFCPNRDPRSSAGYICRASLPLPIPLLKGSVRFGVVTVGAFSDHLSVRRQAKQEDQHKRHHEGQANEPYENAHEQPSDRGKCRQPSERAARMSIRLSIRPPPSVVTSTVRTGSGYHHTGQDTCGHMICSCASVAEQAHISSEQSFLTRRGVARWRWGKGRGCDRAAAGFR